MDLLRPIHSSHPEKQPDVSQPSSHTIQPVFPHFPVVILAAGRGQRLKKMSNGIPKPLVKIHGLSLLERAILTAREVGLRDFYVVVGYRKQRVIQHIRDLARRYGLSIQIIENPDWPKGNGTSVLAAAEKIRGPFVVMMCDHIIDPDILKRLLQQYPQTDQSLLAVDRTQRFVFDHEDATKVTTDADQIVEIGKQLQNYNAIDTGVFLFQRDIVPALRKALAEGDGSLSAGVRKLAHRGRIAAVDIGSSFWIDVDTPGNFSIARRLLLKQLTKSEDGIVSRYLNRPISVRITQFLANTPLSPNAITVISFLMAVAAGILFAFAQPILNIAGALLTQLSSIVDGCDGEIARLKFQSSRFGAWFDTILDRYADVAIVGGIVYGHYRMHPSVGIFLIGLMAAAGFILYSYTKKEFQLRFGKKTFRDYLWNLLPSSRDVRLFLIFLGGVLQAPFYVLILVAFISHAWVVSQFVHVYLNQEKILHAGA